MPAVKMKAKTTTTCTKDGNYPHVSQKSNKISKLPLSMIRVTNEKENLDISCQTSQNDFCNNEESSKDHDNKGDIGQSCPSFNGCTDSMGQNCLLFNGCTDSVIVRDSLPSSPSSSAENMLTYFDDSPHYANCDQFEDDNREQITREPQVDVNYFDNFQMPDVLDSYVYDVYRASFPSDGVTVFDDSQSYCLSDILLTETNLINGHTEGDWDFETLEETIGAANLHFGGLYEEFQQLPGSSFFNFASHQATLFTEELHVNSSQIGSDRIDNNDQEIFVENFLELSGEANNKLPALISQETSKKKKVTLVLDLDETLVHSTLGKCDGADFTYQMVCNNACSSVSVRKRPFLEEFLEKVAEMFEIIIFTASKSVYSEKLLDILDPDKKFFARRVYRESCSWKDQRCVKDLTVLGIDLAKVFIVDNTPEVFSLQVNNGIPIKSWYDDPMDAALISLLPFLEKLVDVEDVRPIIAEEYGARI